MASKKLFYIFFLLLFFSSCLERNPEAVNNLFILNETKDTIFVAEKYRSSNRTYRMLQPKESRSLGGNYYQSVFDIIRETYQKLDIEIEVYKLACPNCDGKEITDNYSNPYFIGPCLLSWSPPLVSLPDSIHSFYNTNSWVIKKGGHKNKWEIATFTITEKDLKQNQN